MTKNNVTISEFKRRLDKNAKHDGPITSTRINNARKAAEYRNRGKGKKQETKKRNKKQKTRIKKLKNKKHKTKIKKLKNRNQKLKN